MDGKKKVKQTANKSKKRNIDHKADINPIQTPPPVNHNGWDPRSPTVDRTPLNLDPRSPNFQRTPLEKHVPLDDPRSPLAGQQRTPLITTNHNGVPRESRSAVKQKISFTQVREDKKKNATVI